ncbi:Aerobic respiration control sensor protein ArcB [Polystyrenella longa]|uniref:histidine kinase n=1 Tax=Polystyrenella longa TaxID=2528007 RepID=A0A518CP30_9PLAN|nr:PAS domain-containing protein [Polystyrenella longa]QDU80980.1 Aerobic respiration control sensor protein ArcB [Polystyrenella longa]
MTQINQSNENIDDRHCSPPEEQIMNDGVPSKDLNTSQAMVDALIRLHELNARLLNSPNLIDVSRDTLETVVDLSSADFGTLQFFDPAENGLRYVAQVGFKPGFLDNNDIIDHEFHSTCAKALQSGVRVIVEDFETDDEAKDHRMMAAEFGYRAAQSTPLLSHHREVIGMITTHFRHPRKFTEWELKLVDLFVMQASSVIERTRTMAELRESEARFRTMADTAPGMLWITDQEHRCTFLSKGWYDFTGQTESEGLGFGWLDATHPDDRKRAAETFHVAADKRIECAIEYRLRQTDGTYRWVIDTARPRVDEKGVWHGFIGSVIDNHENKIANEIMRENEGRLRIAAEAIRGVFYDYDLRSGVITRSHGLEKVTGYRIEDHPVVSKWWSNFVHPEDRTLLRKAIDRAISEGGTLDCTYRLQHKLGHLIHVWDQAIVLSDELGTPFKVIGCAVDISEQKKTEESLQQARAIAEEANQSRGEFLANMSHEIRTPMTAILGHAEILVDHLIDVDNLQAVETIRRNGLFLLEVINDILDLSKIDAGRIRLASERISVDDLVSDIRSLMDVRAKEKNLLLSVECAGKIPATIQTDGTRLRQILLNLLGNAIKFTERGEVKLVADFQPSLQQMQFDVIDTGVGIDPSQLELLFEPFMQSDNSTTRTIGGTGLGLTISRRLARALGGDVTVKSQPGVGSKFTLIVDCGNIDSIPLINPSFDISLDKAADHFSGSLSGTVLVVDDRRDILYLAARLIEEAGGKVITATNGKDAIELLEGTAADRSAIDVVLMDMQMPQMDGYAATRTLRARGFDKPIIALTANAMVGDRDRCIEAGCTNYTTKPLNSKELLSMIAQYL